MRDFLAGLLLGAAATYWYVTDGNMKQTLSHFWTWASAPKVERRH